MKQAWLVACALSLVVACGKPPPVRPHEAAPSAQVRADLDRAEHAELARRHDLARAAYEQAVADAPDPTTTYCCPSSSKVMGALVTGPKRVCHKGAPVAASSASSPPDPAVKRTLPAVVSRPDRTADAGHLWLQRIAPVR